MRAALLLTAKDLRQRIRDRSAILVGFVVPFGLALVFSLTFGGAGGELDVTYAVVDQDGSQLSTAFVDVLRQLEADGLVTLADVDDEAAARRAVADGDLDAAFVVPAGFQAEVSAARPAQLQVVAYVDAPLAVEVARSLAEGFASEIAGRQLAVATVAVADPGAGEDREALIADAAQLNAPIVVDEAQTADEQLDLTTYLSAGMAVFFLFFTVQFGVASLLEERRDGTLQRLLAAPIHRASIVVGKGLTSFSLGTISMGVLVVASQLFLGAHWGDPVGVALLVVAAVLAAAAITAVVVVLARTPEQAAIWQSVISVLLGALGGVFFDVSQGSEVLEVLSLATPHQWFLRGLGTLQSGGAVDVLPAVGAILAFAAGAGLVAVGIGRWRGVTA